MAQHGIGKQDVDDLSDDDIKSAWKFHKNAHEAAGVDVIDEAEFPKILKENLFLAKIHSVFFRK